MLNSNGQSVRSNSSSTNASVDTRQVSESSKSLSTAQIEFLDFVMIIGVRELSESLKLVHNIALYYSDYSFENAEKSALLNLKVLWEGLEKMEKEL